MLSVGVALSTVVVALFTIFISHWVRKWRNPKCENGVLPPGSMGFPLIGETIQLLIPNRSLELHPFISKRVQRYGPVFRTNVAGKQVVITTDPKFNHYIITEEGKSVELWYLDTFSSMLPIFAVGSVQKYIRSITLTHFGVEGIRVNLLPQVEQLIQKTLRNWSTKPIVDVKHDATCMIFDFTLKQLYGYDWEKSSEMRLSDKFSSLLHGLLSLPLDIPGTTFHQCVKDRKELLSMLKDIVQQRIDSDNKFRGDFLDKAMEDMKTEKFLTAEFLSNLMFGVLFGNFEPISSVILLTLKFLSEYPSILEELTVVNEVLRLGNVAPGLLRKVTKDIKFNGYTVPAGWNILIVTSAHQLNPEAFKDPVKFNPSRWKDLDPTVISKNFMPFGGGVRQCAGADYARAFVCTFLHVLVTKYSWTKIRGGKIVRRPILEFVDGVHIKLTPKSN
ncbi:hypothetical protein TEA_026247 [Camellia sinensis var. sinensis]|uniref:Cytochrome P450 n=1 Tax=Camellia sinensis var. sinensis TaxID=542762 RepID=A0A4S4DJJ0_CAMSN|nr:hypothetical protein TEA_026247 [Camellia sinensis var. sinensis]